jgi:prolipoprotein diacylglyceryltransferase
MAMPSYRTCVLGGVSIGIVAATCFAARAGLTPLLWLAVVSFGVSIALFLAAITKVLFGIESFSFLHYQLAALGSTGALLAMMHARVLPALDLLALTLAVAQSIGRVGCAGAGCCHGRPFRIGIRYASPRVAEHWSGARLFPVQWLESCALLAIAVAVASTIDAAPGTAFVLYATSYAVARFTLELFRGDVRRHFAGLSEAQWICLVTAIAVATWQRGFTIAVAAALAIAAVAIVRSPRIDFDDLARAVFAARTSNGIVSAAELRISHATTASAEHYTISVRSYTFARALTPREAGWLAALVRDLAHPDRTLELIAGNGGIYHLVVGRASA